MCDYEDYVYVKLWFYNVLWLDDDLEILFPSSYVCSSDYKAMILYCTYQP